MYNQLFLFSGPFMPSLSLLTLLRSIKFFRGSDLYVLITSVKK